MTRRRRSMSSAAEYRSDSQRGQQQYNLAFSESGHAYLV
jgi:hypothetical protein